MKRRRQRQLQLPIRVRRAPVKPAAPSAFSIDARRMEVAMRDSTQTPIDFPDAKPFDVLYRLKPRELFRSKNN
jgi:hypothetical protein